MAKSTITVSICTYSFSALILALQILSTYVLEILRSYLHRGDRVQSKYNYLCKKRDFEASFQEFVELMETEYAPKVSDEPFQMTHEDQLAIIEKFRISYDTQKDDLFSAAFWYSGL